MLVRKRTACRLLGPGLRAILSPFVFVCSNPHFPLTCFQSICSTKEV